ncbi:hypothetical protein LINPERHAP1_LOCUS195 [Linum perenne]
MEWWRATRLLGINGTIRPSISRSTVAILWQATPCTGCLKIMEEESVAIPWEKGDVLLQLRS